MKSRKSKILLLLLMLSGIVAWNTPSSEDIIMGTSNTATSTTGQLGIIGNGNEIKGRSVLVIGDTNHISESAASGNEVKWSLIVGAHNIVHEGTGGRQRNIVAGDSNVVGGSNCLVSGYGNNVVSPTAGNPTYQSAAIGSSNAVIADRGWVIGQQSEVTGYRGVAIGTGAEAKNTDSMALGRYNEEMETNDVVVIGSGTSDTVRQTALRVTNDGGVILGRAQGDISMGAYAN